MSIARSKVTAQGQISVPAEVRRRLGIGPGAILEWDEAGGVIVVRRAGRVNATQIHEAIFSSTPKRASVTDMDKGIKRSVKARRARH